MAKKIYVKNNYLFIEDTVSGLLIEGLAKNVIVSTLSNSSTKFYIKGTNNDSAISDGFEVTEIEKELGGTFTRSEFVDFYTENTGKSNGGGSGEGTVQSVNDIEPDGSGNVEIAAGDIDGINSGLLSFRTLADLQAHPTPDVNGSYKVTNDGSNNGFYSYVSGTTYTLNEPIDELIDVTNSVLFENLGYYALTGEFINNSNFTTTNFLEVSSIGEYYETGTFNTFNGYRIVFFDENYSYVSGIESDVTSTDKLLIPVPLGIKYMAFTVLNSHISSFILYSNTYTSIVRSLQDSLGQDSEMFISKYFDMVTSGELNIYLDNLSTNPNLILDTLGSDAAIKRINRSLRIDLGYTRSNMDLCFTNPTNGVKTECLVRTISDNVGNGTDQRNIMLVGDSLTVNQAFSDEVYSLLNTDGDYVFNQVGTLGTTSKHEGRSSWRWIDYTTDSTYAGSTNAFWIGGQLNFSQYITNNGFSGLDIVIINLGTNDVTQGVRVLENKNLVEYIAQAKTFIDAILADFPSCKISIGLQAVGAPQFPDASGTSEIFRSAIGKLNKAYVENFDDGVYHANVTTHNRHSTIDRVESYPSIEEAIDKRNTDTWRKYTNAVHPDNIGYQQFADADYSKIRAFLSGVL